jgi:molecular chaperone GrpE
VEGGVDPVLFEALKAENTDLKDKLLRAMAELENFRRRAEKEKSETSKYAVTEFARDAVLIGDNLRRAIDAVSKDAVAADPALKTLLDGVEVTERELIKVFERHGITRFDPIGEKFDPHVHEAMIKVDVPNVPADIIVQVLHAGYKIADRVLRPAAVIVAKGSTIPSETQKPSIADAIRPDSAGVNGNNGRHGTAPGDLRPFGEQEAEPDIQRGPSGAPRQAAAQRREGSKAGNADKRPSSMTKPVTDASSQPNKEEFISTFGKRLDGN